VLVLAISMLGVLVRIGAEAATMLPALSDHRTLMQIAIRSVALGEGFLIIYACDRFSHRYCGAVYAIAFERPLRPIKSAALDAGIHHRPPCDHPERAVLVALEGPTADAIGRGVGYLEAGIGWPPRATQSASVMYDVRSPTAQRTTSCSFGAGARTRALFHQAAGSRRDSCSVPLDCDPRSLEGETDEPGECFFHLATPSSISSKAKQPKITLHARRRPIRTPFSSDDHRPASIPILAASPGCPLS
jgi:hypothetical protein